jgi:alkanesulfonate monooxygenase SsuD/methylene tetrahydromethanopterin reductase-like flavin-dependent oxidoreductase (luciferase family)
MGIGAAWNEEEAMAYGIPFPPTRDRFLILEEALHIIRSMWDKDTKSTTFNGRFTN